MGILSMFLQVGTFLESESFCPLDTTITVFHVLSAEKVS